MGFINEWHTSYHKRVSAANEWVIWYVSRAGLGPMYSCTLYSCTRVHILEYSDVLCTHVLLAWCTQYLYSSTFIKYSYFQSTFWVLFNKTMLLFWYQWYWWYMQLLNMMHTVIYQDHASCFFSYPSICVHIDLSDIVLYELSGLIVCSNKTPILWECALWWPWQWYPIGFTPYHHSPWGSGGLSRLLVSGIRLSTDTYMCLLTSVNVWGDWF